MMEKIRSRMVLPTSQKSKKTRKTRTKSFRISLPTNQALIIVILLASQHS